jgi:hypothetical protein
MFPSKVDLLLPLTMVIKALATTLPRIKKSREFLAFMIATIWN